MGTIETCSIDYQRPGDSTPQKIIKEAELSLELARQIKEIQQSINNNIDTISIPAEEKAGLKTFIEKVFLELSSDSCQADKYLHQLQSIATSFDDYVNEKKNHGGTLPLGYTIDRLNELGFGIGKEDILWKLGKPDFSL